MWQPALFLMQNEKYVLKLLKEQRDIVRAREYTVYEIDIVGCLVFVDLLILTGFDCFVFFLPALQELYNYCLHWGPSTQQPEPSPLSPADVQPWSQRGHENWSRFVKPAGTDASL